MLRTQPLEVRDFSGGLTDDTNSSFPNTYLKMDNLLFSSNGHPFSRYGSLVYNNAQLPSGNQRVSKIVNYNNDQYLIAMSGNRAFYDNAGTWTEILSPSGGAALPGATTSSNINTAEWKRHIFVTSDSQIQPVKIIKDDTLGWRSITAGLPKMASPQNYVPATAQASLITLANNIRTQLLAHFANTFMHKVADTVSQGLLSAPAATDLPSLLTLTTQMQQAYQNHFNDYQGPSKYHLKETVTTYTQAADQAISTLSSPTTLDQVAVILNSLVPAYNSHWGKLDIHKGISSGAQNVTAAFVYGVTSGPYADLDRALFYSIANSVRTALLQHFIDQHANPQTTNAHKASDTNDYNDLNNNFPTCNDPYSLGLLLSGMCGDYYAHESDAALAAPTYHEHQEIGQKLLPASTS